MDEFKYGDLDVKLHSSNRNTKNDPNPEPEPRLKFNWIAFIVMLISIGIALLVGMLIPGILDEYLAVIIINLIYGFAQQHGFKTLKK